MSSSSNPYITAAAVSNVPGLVEWALSTELACESVEADARFVAKTSSSCVPSSSCVELSSAHPDLLSRALRWAVSFTNAREGPLLPNKIRLRVASAHPNDVANIHRFVSELAEFENEPLEVKTTPEIFLRDGFGLARQFHCVFAEVPNEASSSSVSLATSLLPWISHTPIAMALAHSSYSTWHGPTVYVEDVYVTPQGRRQGVGERLFMCWARAARAAHATRLQWSVLDWNVGAIALYETKIKAEALKEWTLYRLYKDGIERIADNTSK
jgi:ribosomal protein S18 acetylase RimI-like enzyme